MSAEMAASFALGVGVNLWATFHLARWILRAGGRLLLKWIDEVT